jgi:hypothetical protein
LGAVPRRWIQARGCLPWPSVVVAVTVAECYKRPMTTYPKLHHEGLDATARGKTLLHRIVSMLVKMAM